jgi:fatty-acyl-CoA synthase
LSLADCLDLGAALAPTAPCLVADAETLSYAEAQGLSRSVAASLAACGVGEGDSIGVLSANDPLALTCIMGGSRAGVAWTLLDPSDADADELVEELGSCSALFFRMADAELVRQLQERHATPHVLVALDGRPHDDVYSDLDEPLSWGEFLVAGITGLATTSASPTGTTDGGAPEGTPRSGTRPILLALCPLTEATVDRWQPVLAQAGRIVMRTPRPPEDPEARLEA